VWPGGVQARRVMTEQCFLELRRDRLYSGARSRSRQLTNLGRASPLAQPKHWSSGTAETDERNGRQQAWDRRHG
jgi:hypothetical protein